MKLRSTQMKEEFQKIDIPKLSNKITSEQICQIPIQHIKGQQYKQVIYVPQQKIIIAFGNYNQILAGKIIKNKIETRCDANEIVSYYQYVIVNLQKYFLIGIDGKEMIKLKLFNFNIIEEGKLDFCLENLYKSKIIQDDRYENNNFIILTSIKLQFRRMKDLKLQFQRGLIYLTTNLILNRYSFSYQAKLNTYIHSNLRGKMIRKIKGQFKNLDQILLMPILHLNNQNFTKIVNPNSMRVICELHAKQGQYVDSILIVEQKILIILNYSNILAYDTNNYLLLDEVQLQNYGTPYKLNYHKSIGIQIFYEVLHQKFKKK